MPYEFVEAEMFLEYRELKSITSTKNDMIDEKADTSIGTA